MKKQNEKQNGRQGEKQNGDKPNGIKKLSKERLKFFKNLLIEMREKILRKINHIQEENLHQQTREASGELSGYSLHMADAATDTFDLDFNLGLSTDSYEVLHEIDEALERVEDGTFGFSEMSGEFIGEKRLLAVPYARYTLEEQRNIELGHRG
jgi:DnaK suppressor protein